MHGELEAERKHSSSALPLARHTALTHRKQKRARPMLKLSGPCTPQCLRCVPRDANRIRARMTTSVLLPSELATLQPWHPTQLRAHPARTREHGALSLLSWLRSSTECASPDYIGHTPEKIAPRRNILKEIFKHDLQNHFTETKQHVVQYICWLLSGHQMPTINNLVFNISRLSTNIHIFLAACTIFV